MSREQLAVGDSSGNDRVGKSLRERMVQDLQLRGMAERTQKGYLREVRKLSCYFDTPPDRLSEQQVADYLLYLINDCEFAPGSLRVAYSGVEPVGDGRAVLKYLAPYVHRVAISNNRIEAVDEVTTTPGEHHLTRPRIKES